MATWQQIGIAVIGIVIGGGFAFGGIASYAGLTNSQANQQNEINTTMPSSNYQEEPLHLDSREQRLLAYNEDIVFVNSYYEAEDQRQQMNEQFSDLPERFNDRVYVSVSNSTAHSDLLIQYGLTEFPSTVIVGGNQQYSGQPVSQIDGDVVSSEICDAFRQLGPSAAQCF
jgi:ABC-type Fe3+-hydroxamate transport system substrate-binding protein